VRNQTTKNAFSFQKIFQNLEKLIQICTDRQVPVLSIGIPDSDYLAHSVTARSRRDKVNGMLEDKASNESDSFHYIPCPIIFEENSKYYDADGLHFSAVGYKELGKSLAPHVVEFLKI
jgi:lysophospholipase L1-like esterase